METSLALAYFPHLVATTADGKPAADEGPDSRHAVRAVNRGWVSITRPWHCSPRTPERKPASRRRQKGRPVHEVIVERISKFLVELSAAKLEKRFPY